MHPEFLSNWPTNRSIHREFRGFFEREIFRRRVHGSLIHLHFFFFFNLKRARSFIIQKCKDWPFTLGTFYFIESCHLSNLVTKDFHPLIYILYLIGSCLISIKSLKSKIVLLFGIRKASSFD